MPAWSSSPRRVAPRRRAAVRAVAALTALASVVTVSAWQGWGPFGPDEAGVRPAAPWEFSTDLWDSALGGDAGYTDQTYADLSAAAPGLTGQDAGALRELSTGLLTADLTGTGRDAWVGYWPPTATTATPPRQRCTDVDVLAASPAALPVEQPGQPAGRSFGRYAKVLVAFAGTCGGEKFSATDPGIEHMYAGLGDEGWVPVRAWDVPAPRVDDAAQAQNSPADWQLKALGPCGVIDGDVHRARTVVADAFAAMCSAAKADGVVLVVESAHRTRQQQADLFAAAVDYYGGPDAARQWVAYADDQVCQSRACSGMSVGVEPDHAALTWLRTPVACTVDGATTALPAGQSCAAGTSVVLRSQQFGFVAPVERIPGYLEFVLPVGDAASGPPDCDPAGVAIPHAVASVFRCRLARAGVVGAAAEQVVAEALVVSKCSSQWNPAARVFAGRYATSPNPADGRVYSEAGVFALRAELADAGWVPGDRDGMTDPVANINAAASLWLATRGWEQFPCATGTDPALDGGPVLPAYGGADLPAWATQY